MKRLAPVTLTRIAPLFAAYIICLLLPHPLVAETKLISFSPPQVNRGGSFRINVLPTPKEGDKPAFIKVYRNGKPVEPAPQTDGFSVTVPEEWDLGTYQVQVEVNKVSYSGDIRVRPPGDAEIKLDAFSPPYTHDAESIWVAPVGAAKPEERKTVSITLRGSGFVTDRPTDNTIWINGIRQNIHWGRYGDICSTAGSESNPISQDPRGEVIDTQEIKLCHVAFPADRTLLVTAAYGDIKPDGGQKLTVYTGWMTTPVVAGIALLITVILAGLAWLILGIRSQAYEIAGQAYRWSLLFLDQETDTYSLSKFQFYLWTLAAIFAYAYLYVSKVFVQGAGWPDIPGTLPGIVGIGAGTAIGSQIVTAANGAKGAGPEKPGFRDFLTSGGVAAADRIQMFLWTLFGVGAFCVGVLQKGPGMISGIQPIPDNMMYMMGLSSVGYLGGKMARKPGPVITDLTVTPGQSDQALAQAATNAVDLPDLSQALQVAAGGLAALPKVANANAQAALDTLGKAIKAAGAVHTTSDIGNFLTSLTAFQRDCENAAQNAANDFAADPSKATPADAAAAQRAAALLQDFSADVTQAIATAASPSMADATQSVTRVIELRGANLSPDGTFEIGHAALPFRMLIGEDGNNAPEVVARQDGGNFATLLRFTIDPARLDSTDLAQYQAWFGQDAKWLATLTNPDGQKADQSFSLPPAVVTPTQQGDNQQKK